MFAFLACEEVSLAPGALDAIMTASGGDMRKCVTFLQSAHQLCGGPGSTVTTDIVVDISGQVRVRVRVRVREGIRVVVSGLFSLSFYGF